MHTPPPTASLDRAALRRNLRDLGYRVLPTNAAKAPTFEMWQVARTTDADIAGWDADPTAVGTGIRLGSAWMAAAGSRGRSGVTHGCKAGDVIGPDFDLDDPADRRIYEAAVRWLAGRLASAGPLVEVGRADGGASARVKILLRAAEDFPDGTPLSQTVHFEGHLSKTAALRRGTAPFSRSVECYAAGRQFVVAGPNAKAGCDVEIRIDGVPSPLPPPVALLPSIRADDWTAFLAFVAAGCGLGLQRAANERLLPAANTGGAEFAPIMIDPDTAKVIDGRETALTRIAFAAHAKAIDDSRVPIGLLEDPNGRAALVTDIAWRIVERDVDLTRPRDGGSGRETFWTRDDMWERVGRADRANAAHHLADRRVREQFAPPPSGPFDAARVIAELADAISPVIDRRQVEDLRSADATALAAVAEAQHLAVEPQRAAALAPVIPDDGDRLSGDPLVMGFCNRNEISVLYGPSGVGKTSVVASWGFMAAAGLFLEPGNYQTAVASTDAMGGRSFTHFDHAAAHVLIACEGAQVIDTVRRGVEAELTPPQAIRRAEIPRRPVPDWWKWLMPEWMVEIDPAGDRRWKVDPARFLTIWGVEASPGFVVLDPPAAERAFPAELAKGHALVTRERFAYERNTRFIELVEAVAKAASWVRPTMPGEVETAAHRRPVVLSIDNLLEVCPSGEDHEAIAATYHVLSRVNAVAGAGVVLVHHTTKLGDIFAGSASIFRYASTVVEVARDPEDSAMRLFHHQKMRLSFPVPNAYSVAQFNTKPTMKPVYLVSNAMLNPSFRNALKEMSNGGAFYGSFNVFCLDWEDGIKKEFSDIFSLKGKYKSEGGASRLRPRSTGASPNQSIGSQPPPQAWASTPVQVPHVVLQAAPLAPVPPVPPMPALVAPAPPAPPAPPAMPATPAPTPRPARAEPRAPGSLLWAVVETVVETVVEAVVEAPPRRERAPTLEVEDDGGMTAEAAQRRILEICHLMPTAFFRTGIRWVRPEPKVPKAPTTPRAPKPKPVEDTSYLPDRSTEWVRSLPPWKRYLHQLAGETRDHWIAVAAANFAADEVAHHAQTRMPPPPPVVTDADRRSLAELLATAPQWRPPAAEPPLPPSAALADDIPF